MHGDNSPAARCAFFAGLLGTQQGIAATKNALEDLYGPGNVIAVESLASIDTPRPDRLVQLARLLFDQEPNPSGAPLDLVLHSGGMLEFCAVAAVALQTGMDICKTGKIRSLYLVSPAGLPLDAWDGIRTGLRLVRLGMSMFADGIWRGIDSLALVPMPAEQIAPGDFWQLLRETLSTVSMFRKGVPSVSALPEYHRRRIENVIPRARAPALAEVDRHLLEAARLHEGQRVRRFLTARGHLLARECSNAFDGRPWSGTGDRCTAPATMAPPWLDAGSRSLVPAILDFACLVRDVVRNGSVRVGGACLDCSPLALLRSLQQTGAHVHFFVPEYDTAIRPEDAVRVLKALGQSDRKSLYVLEGLTHAGFAIHPDVLASAIAGIIDGTERPGGNKTWRFS